MDGLRLRKSSPELKVDFLCRVILQQSTISADVVYFTHVKPFNKLNSSPSNVRKIIKAKVEIYLRTP